MNEMVSDLRHGAVLHVQHISQRLLSFSDPLHMQHANARPAWKHLNSIFRQAYPSGLPTACHRSTESRWTKRCFLLQHASWQPCQSRQDTLSMPGIQFHHSSLRTSVSSTGVPEEFRSCHDIGSIAKIKNLRQVRIALAFWRQLHV